MEYKSEQKHLLISPRKLRLVANVIKRMTPAQSIEKILFIKKRGSEYLYKVIKSAISNAIQKGADVKKLVFKEIQITEGPRLRRGMPVSRGRWHPIKKRMSHIRVILTEDQKQESRVVKDTKSKNGMVKKGEKNGPKN